MDGLLKVQSLLKLSNGFINLYIMVVFSVTSVEMVMDIKVIVEIFMGTMEVRDYFRKKIFGLKNIHRQS